MHQIPLPIRIARSDLSKHCKEKDEEGEDVHLSLEVAMYSFLNLTAQNEEIMVITLQNKEIVTLPTKCIKSIFRNNNNALGTSPHAKFNILSSDDKDEELTSTDGDFNTTSDYKIHSIEWDFFNTKGKSSLEEEDGHQEFGGNKEEVISYRDKGPSS